MQRLIYRAHGCLYQIRSQLIELCLGQGQIQMLRAGCVCGNEGQIDVGGRCGGQLDLCLLCGFLQSLHCHLVAGQVNALCLLELGGHPVNDPLVKVIATQVVVAGSCQNLCNPVAHVDDGYIEGTAAQVEYHDLLLIFLVDAVGQSRSSRLVDDSLDGQPCDLTCVLGCLTLAVGEVCGNGDNRLRNLLAQVCLSVCLQLLQDHSGDLLGRVGLALDLYLVVGAHVTLDGAYSLIRVGDSLALCHLTYQTLAVLGECHNGRGGSCTLSVGDYHCIAAFHNGYAGVGCTKVDTNNFCHNKSSSLCFLF